MGADYGDEVRMMLLLLIVLLLWLLWLLLLLLGVLLLLGEKMANFGCVYRVFTALLSVVKWA